MEWYKTPKFKSLRTKWYKKLKDKGFEDIEQDDVRLKQWSDTYFKRNGASQSNNTIVKAKLAYYSSCRQFLEEYKFKNKIEKQMFAMHSEGIGIRVIAVELKTYRTKVHKILQRLVKEMWKK